MLIPLELPPGVYRNGTDLQAAGRWRDASLVRWIDGTMRPVGGWVAKTTETVSSAPRGALAWQDNSADRWLALGGSDYLNVMSSGGAISNITPAGLIAGGESATLNTGFGGGFYGAETYGTRRSEAAAFSDPVTWALDTWGEYLVACSPADGKLYEWTLGTGTPAAVIANAPEDNEALVVTSERFLFALGADGDARKISWSDREDNATWSPLATNEAGDFTLQTSGAIKLGRRTRGQTLILTDQDAHTATYVGPPFVYGFDRVGTACGAISRRCAAEAEGTVFWMGDGSFHMFAGGSVQEIRSDVSDYVFSGINTAQRGKVYAVANTEFSEIWWFYPRGTENDSYVVYNYKENHWSTGSMARSAAVDRGVFRDPLWVDPDGNIYTQETGFNYAGGSIYAESGPISLGAGDQVMDVTDLIPDEQTQGDVSATFKTRFYPNDTEYTHGPYSMATPTSVRFQGRQVRMRIDSARLTDWRMGVPRLEARPMGRR